jgi:hypothetical protein
MGQLLRRRLGTLAHPGIGRRGAMANRDHVAAADEDFGLAQGDVATDQEGGAQHQEGGLAIGFELGPLVRVERVLERKFVQTKLGLELT